MLQQERRGERRYPVRQPAVVRIPNENREIATVTENLSNGGMLLRSDAEIPANSRIEIDLLLPAGPRVNGAGEVLRIEQPYRSGPFLIAIRCDVPWAIQAK
jgi:hypothetical protein